MIMMFSNMVNMLPVVLYNYTDPSDNTNTVFRLNLRTLYIPLSQGLFFYMLSVDILDIMLPSSMAQSFFGVLTGFRPNWEACE